MKLLNAIFVLCAVFLSVCNAYRILAVFPMMTKSHFIMFEALVKILAKRGHQVDVVSHYPQKDPIQNYNDIISLKGMMESPNNNLTIENAKLLTKQSNVVQMASTVYGNFICDFMSHEKFQELVKNPPTNPPYDLVITQALAANCYLGLGYVFKVPVVAACSTPELPWISSLIGSAENLAVFPHLLQHSEGEKMSFWERLSNVFTYNLNVWEFKTLTEEYQTAAMRKYLSPNIPNIREVEKNVALLLVNTHPAINGIKPITPALVHVAGLHVEANEEKLSLELKKWMDESTHGVVYFTLGSMVLIETLPKEQLVGIYKSFEKLSPVRVLMKVVDSSKLPSGLPKNVKTMSWLPQQPLLAHPNTKIFITHGGLGSSQEALYFGIPMIGIPLFSDQFPNIDSLVNKGMSVRINLAEISEQTLSAALNEVLTNSKYKKNADRYSKVFRDNPMKQSEKAVFWIEYIIRNGGDSLKSPAIQYSWFELILLDIYGFLALIIILISILITFSIKLLFDKLKKNLVSARSSKLEKFE